MEDTGLKSQLPCWAALALALPYRQPQACGKFTAVHARRAPGRPSTPWHHSDPCPCVLTVWFTSQTKTHFPGRLTASFLPGSPHRSLHTHMATHTPPASGQPSTQSCPPGPGCICQPNTFLLNWEGFDHCSPFFLMTFQAIVFTDSMYMKEAHILYLHFKSLSLFLRPCAFFPVHSTWSTSCSQNLSPVSSVTPRQRHTVCLLHLHTDRMKGIVSCCSVVASIAPWMHTCSSQLFTRHYTQVMSEVRSEWGYLTVSEGRWILVLSQCKTNLKSGD